MSFFAEKNNTHTPPVQKLDLLEAEKKSHAKTKELVKRLLAFKDRATCKIKQATQTICVLKKRDSQMRERLKAASTSCKEETDVKSEECQDCDEKTDAEMPAAAIVGARVSGDSVSLQENSMPKLKLKSARQACASIKDSIVSLKDMLRGLPSLLEVCQPALVEALAARERQLKRRAGREIREMQKEYEKEVRLRRYYFNQVQELKGNIRVYCRVRPLIGRDGNSQVCVSFPDDVSMVIRNGEERHSSSTSYEFEKIFRLDSTQDKVNLSDPNPLILAAIILTLTS